MTNITQSKLKIFKLNKITLLIFTGVAAAVATDAGTAVAVTVAAAAHFRYVNIFRT